MFSLAHYRPARSETETFQGSIQFSLVKVYKKYHPSGDLKFHILGIFESLTLRILVANTLPVCLKLNLTLNTLALLWVK